jgi:hypothetical protein
MPTTYTIIKGNQYFDATLYTGNGSTQTITNAGGFQPDLVWLKSRSAAGSHGLFDVVRGATKRISSDNTGAEDTISGVTAFNTNGFSLGAEWNQNTTTFVAWQWDANGSGVTNTDGSITSTVSANTTSGFSIVTYTAQTSGTATIGHGLGVAPSMIIVKSRTVSPSGWNVYHSSLGATQVIYLNDTGAASTSSGNWNNTAPTSTVFTSGTGFANGGNMVAYCFAEINGYSKFGSYTGNGSADGPFIYTGFRPAFIMIKSSTSGENWITYDNRRLGYNLTQTILFPNTNGSEETSNGFDFLSNGFKLRASTSGSNGSGQTYIYMAFAEMPTKYANAR